MELLDVLVKRAPESNHPKQIVRIATGMCYRETRTSIDILMLIVAIPS
jgi:hypothetical protein